MEKSPEEQHPVKAFGWAARDASGVLSPFHFSRRYVLLDFFYFFFLFENLFTEEQESCFQGNWRKGCEDQNFVLWNLSH